MTTDKARTIATNFLTYIRAQGNSSEIVKALSDLLQAGGLDADETRPMLEALTVDLINFLSASLNENGDIYG